jgi:hypothetical protein
MEQEMEELRLIIEDTPKQWSELTKNSWFNKPEPEKWSKSEVVGHLIDSAQNNIQRFVRAQYENAPKVFYAQNDWVALQHYQKVEKDELIQLWTLLNRQIIRIVRNISKEKLQLPCYFKVDGVEQTVTLDYVIRDYLAHLKHHLAQI